MRLKRKQMILLLAATVTMFFGSLGVINAVDGGDIETFKVENIQLEEFSSVTTVSDDNIIIANDKENELQDIEIEIIAQTNMELLEKQFYYVKEIPLSEKLQKFIYDQSKEHDLQYIDVLGLIATESDFRPNTLNVNTNGTKDHGLFQMNDCNIPTFRKELNITGSVIDVYNNTRMGVYELSNMSKKWASSKNDYDQHLIDILSSYNKGYAGYKKNGPATKYLTRFNTKKSELIKTINKSVI